MGQFSEALNDYSKKPVVSGAEDGSVSAFLTFVEKGGYNIGDANKAIFTANSTSSINKVLGDNLPIKDDTSRLLNVLSTNMASANDDESQDVTYLTNLLQNESSTDRKGLKNFFKRNDLGITTVAHVREFNDVYRQKRIEEYYKEVPQEREASQEELNNAAINMIPGASVVAGAIDVVPNMIADFRTSIGSSDAQSAAVDLGKLSEQQKEIDVRQDGITNLLNKETSEIVAKHRDEAVDLLGFGDSGLGGGITDDNLVKALNRARNNLDEKDETNSVKAGEYIERMIPALNGSLQKEIDSRGTNGLTMAKDGWGVITALMNKPSDALRLISQQGLDVVETIGASVAGGAVGAVAGPVGATVGVATANATVEYNNAFGQQLIKDASTHFKKNGIEVTKENLTTAFENEELVTKWMDTATDVASARAAFAAVSGGLGTIGGIAKPVATKIGASIAAVGTDVAGGAVESSITGEQHTSANVVLDAMFGTMSTVGTVAGVTVARRAVDRNFPDSETLPTATMNKVADTSDTMSGPTGSPYGLTPDELHGLGLTKAKPVDSKLTDSEFLINDKNWIGDNTRVKFADDTSAVDKALFEVSSQIIIKAVDDGHLTTKSSSDDVANFITSARRDGYESASIDAPTPPPAVSTNPSALNQLGDTPKQARARNAQRKNLLADTHMNDIWEADTAGKGKRGNLDKATTALYRSIMYTDDNLAQSYAKAAKAYGKSDKFKTRLLALSREDIPVIHDETRVGETGVTTGKVLEVLQDKNSVFRTTMQGISKPISKLLDESINNGNQARAKQALDELAKQSPKHRTAINAVSEQLFNQRQDYDPTITVGDLAAIDQGKSPQFFSGANKPVSTETRVTGRQALQYAHGQQLRERLGNVEDVKQLIPNNNTLVAEVVDIVNNSATSGEAFRRLNDTNRVAIRNIIRDLVEERQRLEAGSLEPSELRKKVDNPSYSLIERDVDNTIIRHSQADNAGFNLAINKGIAKVFSEADDIPAKKKTDTEQDTAIREELIDRKVRQTVRDSNNAATVASNKYIETAYVHDDNRKLTDITNDDTDALARSRHAGALAFMERAFHELKIGKLTDVEDQALNAYLKGDVTADKLPEKHVILANMLRDRVKDGSNKVLNQLDQTEQIKRAIGVDSDLSDRKQVIIAHMEDYLTRSYEAFTDFSKWRKDTENNKSDLFNRAVKTAMDTGAAKDLDTARAMVEDAVKGIVASKGDFNEFITKSVDQNKQFLGQEVPHNGSANSGVLKARKSMQPFLRVLLNESHSASTNFLTTIYRQAKLEAFIQRDNVIAKNLIDAGWMKKIGDNGEDFTTLTGHSSMYNKYSAMSDVSVHQSALGGLESHRSQEMDRPVVPTLLMADAVSKTLMLTANPASYMTQVYGAAMLLPHLPKVIMSFPSAVKSLGNIREYIKAGNQDYEFLVDTLSKTGIADSAQVADIQSLVDIDFGTEASFSKYGPRKLIASMNKVYGFPDRSIKMISFLAELDVQTRAIAEDVSAGRLPMDIDINKLAIERAADNTANHFPTPQRSFDWVKKIRTPKSASAVIAKTIMSQFLTFSFEMPRVMTRTLFNIRDDITGENIVLRNNAIRLASSMMATGAGIATLKTMSTSTISPEENQDLIPKFSKGQETMDARMDEDGNWRYRTTEFTNAYSMFSGSIGFLVNPDITHEARFEAIAQIARNNTFGGNTVLRALNGWEKETSGNMTERAVKTTLNIVTEMFPVPVVSHVDKIIKAYDAPESKERDIEINNLYNKFIKTNQEITSPIAVWGNAGTNAKQNYDNRAFRDSLTQNVAVPDLKQMDEDMTDHVNAQFESIERLLPQLSNHLDAVLEVKPDIDQDKLLKKLGRSSSINATVWGVALALYRSGREFDADRIGLHKYPKDTSSFIQEFPRESQQAVKDNLRKLRAYDILNR